MMMKWQYCNENDQCNCNGVMIKHDCFVHVQSALNKSNHPTGFQFGPVSFHLSFFATSNHNSSIKKNNNNMKIMLEFIGSVFKICFCFNKMIRDLLIYVDQFSIFSDKCSGVKCAVMSFVKCH